MTVALVRALGAYTQQDLSPAEVAERACWIEIERLERPIGKQDQYASAFGGLNTITFTNERVVVEPVGLSSATATALSQRLLLFSTGASRDSADILHQQRLDSGSKRLVIDGLHRIKSLAHDMHEAVVHNDLDGFGALLDAAWREKRQLSGKVSTAAIDRCYATAKEAGAIGGKIAGAGGGGFLLLYCPPACQHDLRAAMTEHALQELPFDFDWDGVQVCSSG
jgi:D-glycero-alpha-D-manno-heptose-7-phosphate kinase